MTTGKILAKKFQRKDMRRGEQNEDLLQSIEFRLQVSVQQAE